MHSCVHQTFLVRKSRTSQRNVLCVRLADDSVPSFVEQFGIREEQSSEKTSFLPPRSYPIRSCFFFVVVFGSEILIKFRISAE